MTVKKTDTIPIWEKAESRRLEFKEKFPGGDQVAKTVIAFANGAGGKIIFGVKNDPRNITGIPEDRLFKLEEQIANHVFSKCIPAIIPEIYIQAVKETNLLVVEIFPGSQKPYFLKAKGKHKGAYVRIGSTNKPASIEMLEALERQRMNISFDAVPASHYSVDDINLEQFIRIYRESTGRRSVNKHLESLGVLHRDRNHVYPAHAAVLLSDSPLRKKLFPNAKVECARFKGTDTRVFLDQLTIDTPVYACVELCIAFIKKNIHLSSKMGGVYREDRWEYPINAIREAVSNAVIHRDYAIIGSDIKVAVFDDMLEITSPGPLPDTISVEELGSGRSEIRNRVLAPVFKDLKLIEAWGTGIQKIQLELKKYPEIELVLQETGYAFQVQFLKKDYKPEKHQVGTKSGPGRDQVGTRSGPGRDQVGTKSGLSLDQVQIMQNLELEQPVIELMGMIGRTNRTKFRDQVLNPLIDSGLVEMTIPEKPRSSKQKYIITDQGKDFLKKYKNNR